MPAGASTLAELGALTLVISDKVDVERDAVDVVWAAAGGDVVRLGRFWDPPPLDAGRVRLYGAETFCQVLAQKLGVALVTPPDDLLLHLPPAVTRRVLQGTTLAGISSVTFPAFVKSFVPKLLRSRIYASASELRDEARGLEDGTELVISEIVELVAEARSWILDGQVLSIACYEGDADLADARALALEAVRDPRIPRWRPARDRGDQLTSSALRSRSLTRALISVPPYPAAVNGSLRTRIETLDPIPRREGHVARRFDRLQRGPGGARPDDAHHGRRHCRSIRGRAQSG